MVTLGQVMVVAHPTRLSPYLIAGCQYWLLLAANDSFLFKRPKWNFELCSDFILLLEGKYFPIYVFIIWVFLKKWLAGLNSLPIFSIGIFPPID